LDSSKKAGSDLAENVESAAPAKKIQLAAMQKFISNFLGGSVRGLLYAAGVFWVVPLLVRGLGNTQFGLYAIAATFLKLGYYGAFDFGLSTAITKYAAEARSGGNTERISNIATAGLVFYVAVSSVLCLTFGALGKLAINAFSHRAIPATELSHDLQLALLAYCLYLISNTFLGLLAAHPGFHLTHWIGCWAVGAEIVGVTILYFRGLTLSRVFLLHIVIASVVLIASYFLARHYYRELHFTSRRLRWDKLSELSTYGSKMGLYTGSVFLSNLYDKLVIGYFSGPIMIGQYEAASRIIDLLRRVPQMVFLPLLPISSELSHRGDQASLRSLYLKTFRALLIIAVPAYLVAASAANPFMISWLGRGYGPAAFVLVMFSLAAMVNSFTLPGSQILSGMGKFSPILQSVYFGFLCYLVLDPLLASLYGFKGAITGSALSLTGGSIFFILRTRKVDLFRIDFAALRPATVLGIVGGGVLAMPIFLFLGHRQITISLGIAVWLALVYLFWTRFERSIGHKKIAGLLALVRETARDEANDPLARHL